MTRETILASGAVSEPPIHTQATARPWSDAGEHKLTRYGDINHVILGADGKTLGSLYANCFNSKHMDELPTITEAHANATLIVKAVNRDHHFDELVKALEQCAAAFSTGPGTVATAHEEIAREFQRRMNIASAALAGAK